jgi:hypothetical protein
LWCIIPLAKPSVLCRFGLIACFAGVKAHITMCVSPACRVPHVACTCFQDA